jgi:predicted SnoaL-like aldol condensation-catalyzing enzyme
VLGKLGEMVRQRNWLVVARVVSALLIAVLLASGPIGGTDRASGQEPEEPPESGCGLTAQERANKAMVVDAYGRLFNDGDLAQIDRHWRPDYIQHSPLAPDGREALREFVIFIKATFPEGHLDFRRVLAEGDLVLVHSHLVPVPGTRGDALLDIFRVQDGKIAEHWDVTQAVPETTASGNDMFSTLSSPQTEEPLPGASRCRSRRVALALYEGAVVDHDVTAFDRHAAEPYFQHNPGIANGREAAKAALEELYGSNPRARSDVKRVIAEGDLVAVHHHFRLNPDDPADRGSAVLDIFRVKKGRVVEHWDITQAVPETSLNDNTMF